MQEMGNSHLAIKQFDSFQRSAAIAQNDVLEWTRWIGLGW